MRGHTPEPWGVWNHDGDWTIEAMSKKAGCMVDIANASFSEPDARRIVACVNACSGIPLEVLESPGYSVKAELDRLDDQIRLRFEAEKNVSDYRREIEKLNESIRAVLGE